MKHGIFAALAVAGMLAMGGCAQLQQFSAGDLANAVALAAAGKDSAGAACWAGLAPVVAVAASPSDQGLATLAERKRLLAAAVEGECGAVIAPALLEDLGKLAPAPANLLLPF
jgi:hypothetical protein